MNRTNKDIRLKQWLAVLEEFFTSKTINEHYIEIVQWYVLGILLLMSFNEWLRDILI